MRTLGSVAVVLFCLVLVVSSAGILRDGVRYARVSGARRRREFARTLELPSPRGRGSAAAADYHRVISAVMLGRYQDALDLLERVEAVPRLQKALAREGGPGFHALVARVGLGRYREVLALTNSLPRRPETERSMTLRAQAAIELGDYELVDDLLGSAHEDALHEAGRKRVLGDLSIRRGDIELGRRLVGDAIEHYEMSSDPACEVDRGYCLHHLAEAAAANGELDRALELEDEAIDAISSVRTNAPGAAFSNLFASRLAVATADLGRARRHLATGREAVQACGDPDPLVAVMAWTEGDLAAAAGDRQAALDHYRHALELFRAMEAVPDAVRMQRRIDALG